METFSDRYYAVLDKTLDLMVDFQDPIFSFVDEWLSEESSTKNKSERYIFKSNTKDEANEQLGHYDKTLDTKAHSIAQLMSENSNGNYSTFGRDESRNSIAAAFEEARQDGTLSDLLKYLSINVRIGKNVQFGAMKSGVDFMYDEKSEEVQMQMILWPAESPRDPIIKDRLKLRV